jgi:hypothetical protein
MSLSFLYRGNAELCSAMAKSAKSEEIRHLWKELAEHWWQKAESDKGSSGGANHERGIAPNITGSSVGIKPNQNLEASAATISSPTLVAEEERLSQTISEDRGPGHQGLRPTAVNQKLEIDWAKLLADIRAK